MSIPYFGHSDIGSKRERNEDSYLCFDLAAVSPGLPGPTVLLMVADGIGGQAGGGVASVLATDSIKGFVLSHLDGSFSTPEWRNLLAEAFQEANRKILEKIGEDINLTGMGTTLVAAVLSGGSAFVANIGDSRAYHIRAGEIVQITRDHSWVAEQARLRTVSDWELSRSPFRHMITRSLGFEPKILVDAFEVELAAGDFVLLCSDGLYSVLPDRELVRFFKKNGDPEAICLKLLKSADRAGSRDNVTAVVARWGEPASKGERRPRASSRNVGPGAGTGDGGLSGGARK